MKRQAIWDGLRIACFVVLALVAWGFFMQTALYRALNERDERAWYELAYAAMYSLAVVGVIVVCWGLYRGLLNGIRELFGQSEDRSD
jgi:hypothetical protein